VLFGGSLDDVGPEALALVAREVPTAPLPPDAELDAGLDLVSVLVDTGLASSRSDARRSVEQHAVSVNGERVGADRTIGPADVRHGGYVVLRKGKRSYAALVRGAGGRISPTPASPG
jgi:tyrosyl-tRNA synthetase